MFSHKAFTHKDSAFFTLRSACLALPEENQGPSGFQGCECREELLNSTENKHTQNWCLQPLKTLSGIVIKNLPYNKVLYCSNKESASQCFASGWFECPGMSLHIHFVHSEAPHFRKSLHLSICLSLTETKLQLSKYCEKQGCIAQTAVNNVINRKY